MSKEIKYGILLCAYDSIDTVEFCVQPWLNRDNCIINAVSVPFKDYEVKGDDGTQDVLKKYNIPFFEEPKFLVEADARNMSLRYLKQAEVDYVWLLDADEIYNVEEIDKIMKFVESQSYIDWFKINFKNYVFDNKRWTDGFCPPRIFKTEELGEFYWDNDISFYKKGSKEEVTRQEERVSMIIPKGLAHVRHMTWLSNEKGKKKVEYQNRHFGHNGEHCCSYAWSHDKNELIFNEAYYKHHNLVLPTIYED